MEGLGVFVVVGIPEHAANVLGGGYPGRMEGEVVGSCLVAEALAVIGNTKEGLTAEVHEEP